MQYIGAVGAVGLGASLAGVALEDVAHYVFVSVLSAGLVAYSALPAANSWPALFGLAVGLTLLGGFGPPRCRTGTRARRCA